MLADLNGKLFRAIFSLVSLEGQATQPRVGRDYVSFAGKRDSGFRTRGSISSLISFFICFRLSL